MKVIDFEGLSGSGKTTLINFIKNSFNCKVIEEHDYCPFPFEPENEKMIEARQHWFLGQNISMSEEIKKDLKEDSIFLLDRYYPSTLSFSYSYSKMFNLKEYEKTKKLCEDLIKKNIITEPDYFIYVHMPSKVSNSRYKITDEIKILKKMKEDENCIEILSEFYDCFFEDKDNVLRINGTNGIEENIFKIKKGLADVIYHEFRL